MNNLPQKITIIGMGLIGGSIAMGIKKRRNSDVEITDVTKNEEIPLDSDLIIIATPIFEIIKVLNKLDKILVKKTLVIDVGSTKQLICSHAAKLKNRNIIFVGTHPMGGRELTGLSNADPNLFVNKSWVICPVKSNTLTTKIIDMVRLLGANPLFLNPMEHDKLVTYASHVSLVAGSILTGFIAGQKSWDIIAKLASTGFRDTTRLASFSPKIKADIVATNKNNVLEALNNLEKEMEIIKSLIERENWKSVEEYFKKGKQTRDNWINNYFS